jgi:hypothetical protein
MISLPFLKEIAAILLKPGEYNLAETWVVFPNKRARLYLSKFIGELTDKPVWAPRYVSINELMEGLSGLVLADRLTLLFELFSVYRQATGSPENFDNFYPYADALLADFDETDKYLANASDLFSNLAGLKAMEGKFSYLSEEQITAIRRFWNTFDPENTSEGQRTFLSLWEVLPEMYSGLRDRLEKKGLAYEGMAYRRVAEDLSGDRQIGYLDGRKYVFIGFNALNKCEEKLFRYLKNYGMADFFWDYDNWYTDKDFHEAGFFIRKNLIDFPPKKEINHDSFSSQEKRIWFLPVPSNTGQAGALPFVFEKLGIKNELDTEHVALVLADENLLIPALYAIPEMVSDLNITMGYPIAGSAVFNLVDSLYELARNRRLASDGTPGYYYKDVISILGNPLLKTIYQEHFERVRDLVVEKNLVYLSPADILSGAKDDLLFQAGVGEGNACQYLLAMVEYLLRLLAGPENQARTDPVQLEILFQVYNFLTRLKDILAGYSFAPERETLFRLIRRMLRTLHIPFSGEPLSGLQLLGILETRTLDFDHVIILSMNEGVLPRSTAIPSFIPQNLRIGFGLPTPEHQDSIYAYTFFRLIQRASNVVLVYDSSTGGLRTGERSRFLHQLYYELPEKVTEINPVFPVVLLPVMPITVKKAGRIAESLMRYTGETAKLLSPSAVNEFLNCSLRFYFHHIAGLPQPDEITEEIDARMFGNLLHKSMQYLYGTLGSSLITPERLGQVLRQDEIIDNALNKAFSEELFGGKEISPTRKIEGFNQIVRQVLKSYIRNLIKADQEGGAFTLVDLEKRFSAIIPVSVEGRTFTIQVGGTIDRVDLYQGSIRIIDYKTGTIKKSFGTVESLFDGKVKTRNDAVFQVLMYAMVYHKLNPGSTVLPALCFVRGSNADNFSYHIQYGEKKKTLESYQEIENEFESMLKIKLAGLFDAGEPFTQTTNRMICQTCPYAVICRREGDI